MTRRSASCDLIRGVLIAVLVTEFFFTDAEDVNGQFETPMSSAEQRACARESSIADKERRDNAEEQCFHDFDVRFVAHRAVTRLSDEAVGLQTK